MQTHRADDQAAGTGGDQLIMQRVTETAGFIDGMHGMAGLNFLPYPGHQPGHAETLGGLGMLMIGLDGDGDLFKVHVQAELEDGFDLGVVLRCDLCCVVHVMNGLMVGFHTPECVPVLHALVNPSWHLTATAPSVFG